MKKIVCILLALVMAVSLCACGSNDDVDPTNDTTGTNTTADRTYTIGICQLVQHDALDAATQGFKDALTEKLGDNVIFDTQNANNDIPTCLTIANGFVSAKVDLILANATPALQAAQSATGTIPIIGTSVTDYATALEISDWQGTTGSNITGTCDLAPLDQQAAMLNEIFPEAETVGILYCSGEPNSKYQADVIRTYLEGYGYTVSDFTFTDSNDIAAVTTTASTSVDVLYIPTDNTAANNTEVIKNIVVPAGVPVIAGESGICSGCGVATLSISYYDIGYIAGEMAYDILVNGADPATMEIKTAPNVTKLYNAEICEALNITPPEGYQAIEVE